MQFRRTDLPDVILIEPDVYPDARGFFLETYHARKYREGGVEPAFVQDNHSRSERDTIRGLHAQRRHPQGKLIRVVYGEIFDVAVDVRRGSPTFGRWVNMVLSADNRHQCYIPPGFAHGFCVTSDAAEIEYKCTDFYDPTDELRIRWDDPGIGIVWPTRTPLLSDKDRSAPSLAEITDLLAWSGGPTG